MYIIFRMIENVGIIHIYIYIYIYITTSLYIYIYIYIYISDILKRVPALPPDPLTPSGLLWVLSSLMCVVLDA